MKLKKIEFPYDKEHSWRDGNPYTVAFCHPPRGESFILAGGLNSIRNYLETKVKTVVFVVQSYWYRGQPRFTTFEFYNTGNLGIYFNKASKLTSWHFPKKFQLTVFTSKFSQAKILFSKDYNKIPSSFPRDLSIFLTGK